jgi:hypothetical protein
MPNRIGALSGELGEVSRLLADTGYFSTATVIACEAAGVDLLIAMGRQPHHPPLSERFTDLPAAPRNPTPVEAMTHRLKTTKGAVTSMRCAYRSPDRWSASSNP